ncbi:HPr-rel-A system PqqD family peptide chaperone [Magnetospira sp. QH-2]|uniref:HPr-rel-A system PqqD family peptide chaperone n=1 Tax=Magnetospira sp. (strain QH-2) TaxID=1288970 RepID=UPI0003E8187D|nr:HPr-rel-A system PqqD family peptide chaperone [Magnetospira sp. QH-2]CCQ72875.1 Conserved protein of unknown function [Magnetospira sp. QH-2]
MQDPEEPLRNVVRLFARLSWKTWNDEVVVYDDASGHTHLLESNAAEVLVCLEAAGGLCPRDEFEGLVAEHLAVSDDEREEFQEWLAVILAQFRRMDLLALEAQ